MNVNGCVLACACICSAGVTHGGDGLPFWQMWRFGNSNRESAHNSRKQHLDTSFVIVIEPFGSKQVSAFTARIKQVCS